MTETDTAVPAGCTETGERMHWNEAAGKYTHPGRCSRGREHRHLELTIYPPNPMPGPDARRWEMDVYWAKSDEEREAWIAKTLPEACLAAEYWRAVWEYDARFPEDAPGWHWHHDGDDSEVIIEHEVLLRFAQRPHARSSDYQ